MFFLVGQGDFVYENKTGAKTGTAAEKGEKSVNKYRFKSGSTFSFDYLNKPKWG